MLGDGLPWGRGIPYGYDIGVGTHESGDIIRLDGDGGGIGIAEAEVLGDILSLTYTLNLPGLAKERMAC